MLMKLNRITMAAPGSAEAFAAAVVNLVADPASLREEMAAIQDARAKAQAICDQANQISDANNAAVADVAAREAAMAQRGTRLDAQAAAQDDRESYLLSWKGDLDAQRAAQAQRETALNARAADLDQREADLNARRDAAKLAMAQLG
jgi:hypothetical protein